MLENEVKILIELITESGVRAIPLDKAKNKLEERLKSLSDKAIETDAFKVIQYALDNWIIDKIIDEQPANGQLVWYINDLDKEESQFYHELSNLEKAVIKILRTCEDGDMIGRIKEDDLLSRLRELGFTVQSIPYIPNKTYVSFTRENGDVIRWWYLVTQFELSDSYKEHMDELHDIEEQKHRQRGL